MLRTLAWLLVVWGVAVWATAAFNLLLGAIALDGLIHAAVAGGILVALGYWLERKTRKKRPGPSDDQRPPAEDT